MMGNLVRLSLYVWLGAGGYGEDEGGAGGGGQPEVFLSQMMENLVRLYLYVWLVQVMMKKMKEEQGDEDNQRFLSFKGTVL
jgi:hypothetical protein